MTAVHSRAIWWARSGCCYSITVLHSDRSQGADQGGSQGNYKPEFQPEYRAPSSPVDLTALWGVHRRSEGRTMRARCEIHRAPRSTIFRLDLGFAVTLGSPLVRTLRSDTVQHCDGVTPSRPRPHHIAREFTAVKTRNYTCKKQPDQNLHV